MTLLPSYDIVCIGNYTKDTIITPSGTSYVDGGAMNYAAHAAAATGMKVAVITRLAIEDERVVRKLEQAGVDCYPTYTPSSTLMKLVYPTTNPDERSLSVERTAGTITPAEVQVVQGKAAVIGTSLRGEAGLDVIQALKEAGMLVAADMQGYVRVLRGQSLVYEPWPDMEATLPFVDILKSDAVEAEALTGEKDIYKAARYYAALGAREIVLTHREGLLVHTGGVDFEFGFFPRNLSGRSGRGDTCLGSYTAKRLSASPQAAGLWAAALTSLKMEKPGPFTGTSSEVEAFITEHYSR
jgi:sugar/nucleoside kinase (ribokinase family)